jgi:hypothetical protein
VGGLASSVKRGWKRSQKKSSSTFQLKRWKRFINKLHEEFLKEDEDEESKNVSDVKTLQAELCVQQGGLSLVNKNVRMNLFFTDCGFSFSQYTDERMMVNARTKDFGLEMESDQHFEVIEKMDESEVFWEMQYIKGYSGGTGSESFSLTVNPIKFIYEGSFVKSIVNFFHNESDLQIREQAAEKWVDFKEGAQTQIQESMKSGQK